MYHTRSIECNLPVALVGRQQVASGVLPHSNWDPQWSARYSRSFPGGMHRARSTLFPALLDEQTHSRDIHRSLVKSGGDFRSPNRLYGLWPCERVRLKEDRGGAKYILLFYWRSKAEGIVGEIGRANRSG